MSRLGLAAVALVVMAGCATMGRDFRFEDVRRLVPGVSTRADAESMFGPPMGVGFAGGQTSETWMYGHADFGGANARSKMLTLRFGPDGRFIDVVHMGGSGPDVIGQIPPPVTPTAPPPTVTEGRYQQPPPQQ